MAKARRKFYKRKKKYTFSSIAKNYFKVRLSNIVRIKLDNTGLMFLPSQQDTISISTSIAQCEEWKQLQNSFLAYKVTGIKVLAVPAPLAFQGQQVGQSVIPNVAIDDCPVMGILALNMPTTYQNLQDADKQLILSYHKPVQAYFKYKITEWDKSTAPTDQTGRFYLAMQGSATMGIQYWTVKLTYYVTFKTKV